MIVVTGGAGFIGSHLVRALNERGEHDLLVVDDLARGAKCANLSDCVVADYMDKAEFRRAVSEQTIGHVRAVLHQGACADTTETDGRYMMDNNFTFSKDVLRFAQARGVPFIYASSAAVYGASQASREDAPNERPLNVYGLSKLLFDQYVRRMLPTAKSTVVGLRYFNVYGPREAHKGRMASMAHQLYRQLASTGKARLFEGTDGYADGEQRRDFIFVGDIVDVNLYFLQGPPRRGIFNVGTGRSRSFNDVARRLIQLRGEGNIEYFPFDQALRGRYQSFTEADVGRLRAAGHNRPFTSLEEGIARSVEAWDRDLPPAKDR